MTRNKRETTNPWLSIPWEDYEGHMASPEVRQAQFLSEVFGSVLREYRPAVIAVLGCSTGNGFVNIDPTVTHKVIGVDINPEYLEVLQERHRSSLTELNLIRADLATLELDSGSCGLIYCGLVFEYVEPRELIKKIARWLSLRGTFIVVLQLPSEKSKMVSETKYESLKCLESIMRLVEPDAVQGACAEAGLSEIKTYTQVLESQKAFFVGHYRKEDC